MMSKMTNTDTINDTKVSFKFTDSFRNTFDSMVDSLDVLIDKLRNVDDIIKENNDDYGICNCIYKLRYITPSNVSAYISYLEKAFSSKMLDPTTSDAKMFTVAMVKEFMRENGCVPFESTSIIGSSKYVDPKTQTLDDLLMLCENDVIDTCVYSKYEMNKRTELIKEDTNKIVELHFPSNMKKIINNLPAIINNSSSLNSRAPIVKKVFTTCVEDFILFACALNSVSVYMMLSYVIPRSSYQITYDKRSIGEDSDLVTECCLLKTNNFVIRNRIPFNCNMRDIVLQDVHPNFKDTRSAIIFMLTDDRSPIHVLLVKYGTKPMNMQSAHDYEIVKMFNGRLINYPFCDNRYEDVDFHTDVNWLDKITFGNNYLDGNYRNDANGNHHRHPITDTLEMVHKIFDVCDLRTNEDIANNIIEVSQTMMALIENDRIENWDLRKDILAVLGDILTRSILKLYNNNTLVFSYDDNMEDTMIPGCIYAESFVMEEADNNADKQPTVTNNAPNTQTTLQKIKQKTSEIIKKFMDWVTKQVSSFYTKFNENHKREAAWINKNSELNKQVAEALNNGSFVPTVTNFPKYNIPVNELSDIHVSEIVNKWLNSQDPIDATAIKKSLYPGGDAIAGQIASITNEAEEIAALSNYVLYKQTKPFPPYTGRLTVQLWDDLIEDLTGTGKAIETITKNLSDDLKKACNDLSRKASLEEQEMKNTNNNNSNDNNNGDNDAPKEPSNRASQLFNIVQSVSKTYYVTMLNTLRGKFYRTSYKLYSDIIKAYQQQFANNNSNAQNTPQTNQNNTNQNNTNQQQQQNDPGQLNAPDAK